MHTRGIVKTSWTSYNPRVFVKIKRILLDLRFSCGIPREQAITEKIKGEGGVSRTPGGSGGVKLNFAIDPNPRKKKSGGTGLHNGEGLRGPGGSSAAN